MQHVEARCTFPQTITEIVIKLYVHVYLKVVTNVILSIQYSNNNYIIMNIP